MISLLLATMLTVPAPAATHERACPVDVPANTTCGFLLVPERRDVPGSRLIKVGYAVHRSTAADRKPDPIVFTSGGPGSSSLQLTGFLAAAPFGRDRDVITLEQRGSRHSAPHLDCPELDTSVLDSLSRPGRDAAEGEAMTAAARTCAARLRADGTDLRGYNTAEIAADAVDLRAALGYARWNLFGVSYSTRSMLAAAQLDPAGTRSVVLDSFLPADVDQYDVGSADLRATLDRVEPGLAAKLGTVVDRLNRQPAAVDVTDPRTGAPRTLHLTGDDVASLIAEGMQEADVVTAVPALVDALADGRDDLLRAVGRVAAGMLDSHDVGLYSAVNCQDEVPFNTFAPDAGPRSLFSDIDPAVCRGLGLPPGDETPATTDAPVLVVGGSFDPATPVSTARTAAARLPHATTVEFAGVAHAVFLGSRCGRDTIAAFVTEPADRPAPCDPGKSPYRTLKPGDRWVTALPGGPTWTFGVPGALAVVCLVALVTGAVRRRWSLLTAGLAGPALLGVAAALILDVSKSNPASLMVGVPWPVAWCVLLAGIVPGSLGIAAAVRGTSSRRPPALPLLLAGLGVAHVLWFLTG